MEIFKSFDINAFFKRGTDFLEKEFHRLASAARLKAVNVRPNYWVVEEKNKFRLTFQRGLLEGEDCHKYLLSLYKQESYGQTESRLISYKQYAGTGEKELKSDFLKAVKEGGSFGGSSGAKNLKEEILFINNSFMNY